MFDEITTFSFPTRIVFGRAAVRRLPACLEETGVRKPLVVTDPGLRGEALAGRTAAGTVCVNRCDYLDPELAWVGIKDSGHGCTLSHLGFLHLTRPKSFHLRTRTGS